MGIERERTYEQYDADSENVVTNPVGVEIVDDSQQNGNGVRNAITSTDVNRKLESYRDKSQYPCNKSYAR